MKAISRSDFRRLCETGDACTRPDGEHWALYLDGTGATVLGAVKVLDDSAFYCCDERERTKGAACSASCEHEAHTPDGRMACAECNRPVYWDEQTLDYRHNVDPGVGCFLVSAEAQP